MSKKKEVVRRISALLVADLVGYVGKMRIDEASTHAQVQADFETLFTPPIQKHHGRVVKTMGDGLLAEFSSIVDAVTCAVEVQQATKDRPAELPEQSRFQYKIAINLGDVIIEDNDIYGDGVNLAIRLQGIAEPGSILLSEDAYRQIRGKSNFVFEDLGQRQLKGVNEPIQVFRVAPAGAKNRKQVQSAPEVSSLPAAPSIAVLPLDNLSGEAEQGYLCDGITNDLITDLSKFSELFVIASHTVFTYRGKPARIQDIGRELGVRYVVEGSAQRVGDRIRINMQLIEAKSGRHLWAERYDRPLDEFFKLQDEIVHTIVSTLVTRVHLFESQRVLSSKPDKFQAYDAYLRGRAVWQSWTSKTNRQAQKLFAQAIELNPGFALAYGYLSYTLVQQWLGGWGESSQTLERAVKLAQKAVELGPSEFNNHWSLAAALLHAGEFDEAMAAYQRAYELNPNSPNMLVDLAEALVYVGRIDEATVHIERAMRLNPIYPDWYLWTLGIVLYHSGEYERALEALIKMSNPPNLSRRFLAAVLVRLGRLADARRVVIQFLQNEPTYTLDREKVWPYRNPRVREGLIADLRAAGLPDIRSNGDHHPAKQGGNHHD